MKKHLDCHISLSEELFQPNYLFHPHHFFCACLNHGLGLGLVNSEIINRFTYYQAPVCWPVLLYV